MHDIEWAQQRYRRPKCRQSLRREVNHAKLGVILELAAIGTHLGGHHQPNPDGQRDQPYVEVVFEEKTFKK